MNYDDSKARKHFGQIRGLVIAEEYQKAEKMAGYFEKRCAGLTPEQIERILPTHGSPNPQVEFGARSDVLAELCKATMDHKHLHAARLFNRQWFVGPPANGEDRRAALNGSRLTGSAIGGTADSTN